VSSSRTSRSNAYYVPLRAFEPERIESHAAGLTRHDTAREIAEEFVQIAQTLFAAAGGRQDEVLAAYLATHSECCPMCKFDLIGCTRPFCPECGHELSLSMFDGPKN
jgi:hypothetical protein